jgi:hypothetical protein
MKKYGLYISLLPGGKIKRHLSADFGEMPLPDTTIADELIALTERDSNTVLDELHMVKTLALQVEEDPSSQYPFRLCYGRYLHRLREEAPMWYTLLMAQFCDQVGTTSFENWSEKQAADFMAEGLYAPESVEVTVDIALSLLCEPDPEDPWELNLREDIIHQSTATVFFTLGDTLDIQYLFRSTDQYYVFLLQHFCLSNPKIARCQHCGRYFIPKTRKKTLYCDRIVRDGKTCKEIAPSLTYKRKSASNRIIRDFLKIKRRLVRRVERALSDKKPSLIDMTYAQYRDWLQTATDARDSYLAGELTEEEAMAIIYVPTKDELLEQISSELTLETAATQS